jgi:hypothetical protein
MLRLLVLAGIAAVAICGLVWVPHVNTTELYADGRSQLQDDRNMVREAELNSLDPLADESRHSRWSGRERPFAESERSAMASVKDFSDKSEPSQLSELSVRAQSPHSHLREYDSEEAKAAAQYKRDHKYGWRREYERHVRQTEPLKQRLQDDHRQYLKEERKEVLAQLQREGLDGPHRANDAVLHVSSTEPDRSELKQRVPHWIRLKQYQYNLPQRLASMPHNKQELLSYDGAGRNGAQNLEPAKKARLSSLAQVSTSDGNGMIEALDAQDSVLPRHAKAFDLVQKEIKPHASKNTAKSLQSDLDVIKQTLVGLSSQMGSIKQQQTDDEAHEASIDSTVRKTLSKAAAASMEASRLASILKSKKVYASPGKQSQPKPESAKLSLSQKKVQAHQLEQKGHKMAQTMKLAISPTTQLASAGASPLAQAQTMFGAGGQQAVEDKVIFDEYNKQWAQYVKDFDAKYEPEKYAKNLLKVEEEVAKKAGEDLDKAKKKLLDAAKKAAKDAMEGKKVDAPKSGVDKRFKEYERIAKNVVGHHIWYGNKGYGTGTVVAAAKNAYAPSPMTPQERAIFS